MCICIYVFLVFSFGFMCSCFRAGCSETENELLDAKSITDMSGFMSGFKSREFKFQPWHHFGRQINDSDKVDFKRGGDFARQRTLRVPWERQKPSHTWNSSNSFCQTCNWHSAGNGKSNYWRITSCQTQKDCKVLLSTCEILDVASWCKSTILCAAVYHPICSVDPHALGLKTSNISWLVTELGLLSVPFLLVVCFCKFGRYTSCVCC